MALPAQDTMISYPHGAVSQSAAIVHLERLDSPAETGLAVLLDATSCHPVDTGWPDQGPDRAVLTIDGSEYPIRNCVVGATDGTALFIGDEVPVRKGAEGWAFVVVHVLDGDVPAEEGQHVEVRVDAGYRAALSAGHIGCHLAALALNQALAGHWKKDLRVDGLGHPDFDNAANETSRILEHGSVDTYRLGKSLRKKGFITAGLLDDPAAVQDIVNATLAGWVAAGAEVRIERDGDRLADRRYWTCEPAQCRVSIPCGGTHLSSLAELGALRALLSVEDVAGTAVLTMRTTSRS